MSNLNELRARKQLYIKGVAAGKTKRQSALDAGYAFATARNAHRDIETPDTMAAFARLMRRRVPMHKIGQRIAEGLDATETKLFQKDGVVTDERELVNWAERRASAQLAAEYAGYASKDKSAVVNTAVGIKVIVEHIGTTDPVTAKAELIGEVLER